jgi:hypothetical protein
VSGWIVLNGTSSGVIDLDDLFTWFEKQFSSKVIAKFFIFGLNLFPVRSSIDR